MRITSLLLIFVVTSAQAQQLEGGEFYILGAGSLSCGKWLETQRYESGRLQKLQWILGYLTGYNSANANGLFRSRQVLPPDGESALAFVDRYCSNNSLSSAAAGAMALVESLGGQKSRAPLETVSNLISPPCYSTGPTQSSQQLADLTRR